MNAEDAMSRLERVHRALEVDLKKAWGTFEKEVVSISKAIESSRSRRRRRRGGRRVC